MPKRFLFQFRTEDGEWMDEAICLARRFERLGVCAALIAYEVIRYAEGRATLRAGAGTR
jgi:hypothetical protein